MVSLMQQVTTEPTKKNYSYLKIHGSLVTFWRFKDTDIEVTKYL